MENTKKPPPGQGERVSVTLRLPNDLKEALHREALEHGISFNSYVLLLIYKDRQSGLG